jgi:hypothetical protein
MAAWAWLPDARPPGARARLAELLWGAPPGAALRARLAEGPLLWDEARAAGALARPEDLFACDAAAVVAHLRAPDGTRLRCAPLNDALKTELRA